MTRAARMVAQAPRRRPAKRRSGRPPGSDGDGTRRLLLEAALAAFAERGYDGTSVRDLARQVGVSHNLVHHYYGSKSALWKAALAYGCAAPGRELLALIASNQRHADWDVANRDGIGGAVQLFARHPALARILAGESAQPGPRLDFLFDRYIKPFADLLERLVAVPAGGSRRVDTRSAMLFLFAGMTAPFTLSGLAAKLGGPSLSARDLSGFATTVAEFVGHGLARAGRRSAASRRGRRRPRT